MSIFQWHSWGLIWLNYMTVNYIRYIKTGPSCHCGIHAGIKILNWRLRNWEGNVKDIFFKINDFNCYNATHLLIFFLVNSIILYVVIIRTKMGEGTENPVLREEMGSLRQKQRRSCQVGEGIRGSGWPLVRVKQLSPEACQSNSRELSCYTGQHKEAAGSRRRQQAAAYISGTHTEAGEAVCTQKETRPLSWDSTYLHGEGGSLQGSENKFRTV